MCETMNTPAQAAAAIFSPKSVVEELHSRCNTALLASLVSDYEALLGQSHVFLVDLEAWKSVLNEQPEIALFETAIQEYVLSLMNVCQGQYRNAFKGLRLVLELCLQGAYLSADLILLKEWLKGQHDTIWATLVDHENGPLSKRFCNAFFPDLSDHVANFREIARTVYRELSECIHGNMPKQIPLPLSLGFDKDTLLLWHEKTKIVRLVVLFALTVRYLSSTSNTKKLEVESCLLDQLGHIEAIRLVYGGPRTA